MVDEQNTGFTGVFNSGTITFTYGGAGGGYNWTSNPAGFTSTMQIPGAVSPTQTTTYTVTYTSPNGCTATSNVTVNVNQPPTITLTSAAGTTAIRVSV